MRITYPVGTLQYGKRDGEVRLRVLTLLLMDKHKRTEDLDDIEAIDTEVTEDADIEDIEEQSADKIKKLQKKLKDCDTEKMQYLEDLQRAKAEFLNSRKRLEEQFLRDRDRLTEMHMLALLPLADSFDMAMHDPAWNLCDEKWRKGIEGIRAQLMNLLKQNGIVPINAIGVPFNPHEHEAVSQEPVSNESDSDTVVRVLQAGYRMNESVLRHAKVIVGHKE